MVCCLVAKMMNENRLDLVALVKQQRGIVVGCQRRALEQVTKAHDVTHRKSEKPICRGIDAVRGPEVGMRVVNAATNRRLASIVQISSQNFELQIKNRFKERHLHTRALSGQAAPHECRKDALDQMCSCENICDSKSEGHG